MHYNFFLFLVVGSYTSFVGTLGKNYFLLDLKKIPKKNVTTKLEGGGG